MPMDTYFIVVEIILISVINGRSSMRYCARLDYKKKLMIVLLIRINSSMAVLGEKLLLLLLLIESLMGYNFVRDGTLEELTSGSWN